MKYTVTAGSISRSSVPSADMVAVMDELHRLTGSIPTVTPEADSLAPSAAPEIVPTGKTRAAADRDYATDNGFALQRPIYEIGTVVNSTGVENARRMRAEYDALPTTHAACGQLIERVINERRETARARLGSLQMSADGRISRGGAGINLSEHGFMQLMGRVSAALTEQGQEGLGGAGSFLRRCPPELRARNVNHFLGEVKRHNPDAEVALRYRWGASGREVFASVSPSYTAFDVNRIAAAVALAAPQSARSEVAYDGYRARIQVLFHTTVSPEHMVAGEIFRAGVIVSTDDTGSGAVRVSAVVWQNLCRNLIVIDKSAQETCRLRHVGSEERLASEFRTGFGTALNKVDRFVGAWDKACETALLPTLPTAAVQTMTGQQLREALIKAAIEDVIKRELVPVVGKKADAAQEVFAAWRQDTSGAAKPHDGVNVAALANAFTRYAHETAAQRDPWIVDDIQAAAGQLVWRPDLLRA